VPPLAQAPGFCGALLFAHPASGRMISETIWRDTQARAAAPSDVADYSLVFSSMREL
jgi:hypothetical protein